MTLLDANVPAASPTLNAPAELDRNDGAAPVPRPRRPPPASASRDRELVRRCNAGDAAAFDEIMRLYREKIFVVAYRFLRNPDDAEEIVQDTFVSAHRGLARFRGDASLATWLHRIAGHLACNRYWYRIRRRCHVTFSLDRPLGEGGVAQLLDLLPAEAPDPAREVVIAEFTTAVADCLQELQPDAREILHLRIVQHHSYEEIAALLGVRIGTAKSRIARARANLRQRLAEIWDQAPAPGGPGRCLDTPRATAHPTPVRPGI